MIVSMSTIAKTYIKKNPRAVPTRQLTGAVLFGPACRNRTYILGLEDPCPIH